jgi:hypothetical protein
MAQSFVSLSQFYSLGDFVGFCAIFEDFTGFHGILRDFISSILYEISLTVGLQEGGRGGFSSSINE